MVVGESQGAREEGEREGGEGGMLEGELKAVLPSFFPFGFLSERAREPELTICTFFFCGCR